MIAGRVYGDVGLVSDGGVDTSYWSVVATAMRKLLSTSDG